VREPRNRRVRTGTARRRLQERMMRRASLRLASLAARGAMDAVALAGAVATAVLGLGRFLESP
jgi:hypothetical protein